MNWHCFHCSADLIGFYFLNSVKTFIWFKSGFLAAQCADFSYCVSWKTKQNKPKQTPHKLVNWLNLNENCICYQSKPVLFFSVNFCTSQTDIFAICKYHISSQLGGKRIDCNEKNKTKSIYKFDQSVMSWSKNGNMYFSKKKKNTI